MLRASLPARRRAPGRPARAPEMTMVFDAQPRAARIGRADGTRPLLLALVEGPLQTTDLFELGDELLAQLEKMSDV